MRYSKKTETKTYFCAKIENWAGEKMELKETSPSCTTATKKKSNDFPKSKLLVI